MATRRSRNKGTRKIGSDYVVAIPSYKRAETLRDKTLSVLAEYKIPASKIYVFVADKEQEELYRSVLKPDSYGHMIIGVPGMANIRNFITEYFPVGKRIINMDDDIKGFLEFSSTSRRHPSRSIPAPPRASAARVPARCCPRSAKAREAHGQTSGCAVPRRAGAAPARLAAS